MTEPAEVSPVRIRPATPDDVEQIHAFIVELAEYEPALAFYERLGATRLSAWDLHRLDGDALRRVAAGGG